MWAVMYAKGSGKSLVWVTMALFKESERAFELAAQHKGKQAKVWQCF